MSAEQGAWIISDTQKLSHHIKCVFTCTPRPPDAVRLSLGDTHSPQPSPVSSTTQSSHYRLVPPPLGSLLPLCPRFQASLPYSCPLSLLSTSTSSRASVSSSPRGSWEQTLASCSGHLYTTHQFFGTEFGVVPDTHEGHGERRISLAFEEQAPFHDLTEMNSGLKV